jgi:agmatinase
MRRFAGIDPKYCSYDHAAVLLQSIPYDGTSTWGKGADRGFAAFLDALENMELYDIETDSEAYRHGVHILPDITEDESPEKVFELVYQKTRELLASGKYLTCFGGEHSISIGVIKAFYEKYADLTVLQLDAHADLRDSYGGTPYNHACALHDASRNANLVQVGIRSADSSEMKYLNRQQCYFAEDIYGDESWMDKSIAQMTDQVYLTIDLDAFDPSIMPATGTPEPGGLLWNPTLRYLRKVFEARTVVGFDITEFAPLEGQHAPQFLVAKLYYKLLSYKFKYNG